MTAVVTTFAGLLMLATRVPVVFLFVGLSVAYVLASGHLPLTIVVQRMAPGLDSFPLLAVPLFVLSANLMTAAGITDRIYDFASALLGHIRGGLAYVNIAASMVFAGMSGVATADAAALGKIEVEAMRQHGYPVEFAAALSAVSALIGPVIPPSGIMIIYGVLTGTAVTDLFIAGIIPGFLLSAALAATVFLLIRTGRVVAPPPERRVPVSRLASALAGATPALIAPVMLVGGLLGGFATPTELGAIMVAYAVLLGVAYRELTAAGIATALKDTVQTMGALVLLIAVSEPISWFLSAADISTTFRHLVLSITSDPTVFLLAISAMLFVTGLVLEPTPTLLIIVPVILPTALDLGIDPVHFGIVVIVNVLLGTITPPMGGILFVMMRVANVGMYRLSLALVPFLIAMIAVIVLLILFPAVTLVLPRLYG